MANCMLAFRNRIDASTLSGGSWESSLPISNLKNRVLGRVARSTDATLASTIIDIDYTKDVNVRLFGLINHNFSLSAKARIRGASDSGFTSAVVDTGWVDVWRVVFPYGTLEWEDDNWFDGRYSAEQREGYTATFVSIFTRNYLARYWRIEIDDAGNPDGFVQLGRIFMGPAWQPSVNMIIGASLAWVPNTGVQEAINGAEYFQRHTPHRMAAFELDLLPEAEMFLHAFEIDKTEGIDQEIMWIHDPGDTVHALRRRFLGDFAEMDPIEWPYPRFTKKAFKIQERV